MGIAMYIDGVPEHPYSGSWLYSDGVVLALPFGTLQSHPRTSSASSKQWTFELIAHVHVSRSHLTWCSSALCLAWLPLAVFMLCSIPGWIEPCWRTRRVRRRC